MVSYNIGTNPALINIGNALCAVNPSLCQPRTQPKITTNPDGQILMSQGQTTLDKVIGGVLSSLALLRNAPYIPTTAQPQTQTYQTGAMDYTQLLYAQQLAAQQQGGTGQNIESFIRNNTGLLLVVGAGVVLLMMQPPARRNPRRNPSRRNPSRRYRRR